MPEPTLPLPPSLVERIIRTLRVDMDRPSIRQVNLIVSAVEKELGVRFIRLEFGVPGMAADPVGLQRESRAILEEGVNSHYPPFNGTPEFRRAVSQFAKSFMDIQVLPEFVAATCGAQQGCFLSLAISARARAGRRSVLFLDPGFSVNKIQARFLDLPADSIDLYERQAFLGRLQTRLARGDVAAVLWSSPNNPSWTVLTEEELRVMGDLLTRYDVIGIEDAAYFGMDFRVDYSRPGVPPFVPTVARYTDNYLVLLSASKMFNYAGQRVGCVFTSAALGEREFPQLSELFGVGRFFDAFVQGGIYSTTSGVAHSAQVAVAHLMDEASAGRLDFIAPLRVYGERARFFKRVLLEHGFHLVYSSDGLLPLADGFYFTVAYPGLSGTALLRELLYYGISVTPLHTFGSSRTEGVRVCVSLAGEPLFPVFEERIKAFARDHKLGSGGSGAA